MQGSGMTTDEVNSATQDQQIQQSEKHKVGDNFRIRPQRRRRNKKKGSASTKVFEKLNEERKDIATYDQGFETAE